MQAIKISKEAGAYVALTLGDAGLVERHRETIWELLNAGVDMLFSNRYRSSSTIHFGFKGSGRLAG